MNILIDNKNLKTIYGIDRLDMAVRNLVYMKQIKINTDFLPIIAENTRKTYEKLEAF